MDETIDTVLHGVEFPGTREEALASLTNFLPRVEAYANRRNHVIPGHANVSRLSPALRTRLIRETEVREAVEAELEPPLAEKFLQEVWWRLYWKGALEMRPWQWRDYREALDHFGDDDRRRAARLEAGRSGVAIMDHFARELVKTGYLHNHARMWFAAFWIHNERLPWELGADFFLRHLIDGDAASNTLSWRWVAGLQTPGKTYLVRRSNLEKYLAPEFLDRYQEGLERLEENEHSPTYSDPPPREKANDFPDSPDHWTGGGLRWGWWLHDEDLSVESSDLASGSPDAAIAPVPTGLWQRLGFSSRKQDYLRRAIADGARRAGDRFLDRPLVASPAADSLAEVISDWAKEEDLSTVVALRPFVGPLLDEMPEIEAELRSRGISLFLLRRKEDAKLMRLATGGFFGFWKKSEKQRPGSGNR